ncbi:heme/hemin ABC transporter substrate-binding protein [Phreatobacter sp.]|uniref:heme/hemin ABC transporter substrate-binding protein n=1 Tax=Phreatobacter sp. TaxID=1966341 RepID=UPI003F7028F3
MIPESRLSRLQPNRRAVLATALAAGLGPLGFRPGHATPVEPRRIVAAGGVVTEILYALGAQDRIVGVDATSLHPASALTDKPNVGYVRALSPEGVLSLAPDLVIAIDGAGPPDALRLVAEAGVRVARISEDTSPNGVTTRIRTIGRLVSKVEAAEALAGRVEQDFAVLERERPAVEGRKRVLFVLSLQNGRAMVGGRGSSADAIIGYAGAVNAADRVEGYKPLTDEGIIEAAPDVVLMMERGNHAVAAEQVFGQAAFAATPAARARALVTMDGLYLLGFGPRTPAAARDLMVAVYGRPRPAGAAP